jgi:hypothetical protein
MKPGVQQECSRLGEWQNLDPLHQLICLEYTVIIDLDTSHLDAGYHRILISMCYLLTVILSYHGWGDNKLPQKGL